MGDGRRARGGIDRDAGLRPALDDVTQRTVQVDGRLRVDDQPLAAGLEPPVEHRLGRADHELGLEGERGVQPGSGDDVGSERDVGHELTVHDVPLDTVGPGGLELRDFVAEPREVGGQHGGDDEHGPGHRAMVGRGAYAGRVIVS